MKICMISCVDTLDDTRALRIQRTLIEAGHEVVAIMTPPEAPRLPHDGVKLVVLPPITRHFWRDSGVFNLITAILMRARNALLALFRALRERPEVCLCQEPDSWLIGILVKFLTRAAVVVDLQEIYETRADAFPRFGRRFVSRVIRQLLLFMSKYSDCVIHVSETRRDYYSYLSARTVVVSHFPTLQDFSTEAPTRDPELDGRLVVIHTGPLRPNYAARELLLAIDKARRVVPEVVCLVLGGAAAEENYADLLKGLQQERSLLILPPVQFAEVVRYMKMSDVGITLVKDVDVNHTLAFPRKLFEYMAAGLPVIGANVADVRRVILEEECGRVVDAASPDCIADAIITLARDPEGRKRMGRNAQRAANMAYNWSQPAARLAQLFKDLEATRGGAAAA